jgi:hypothetical protein
VRVLRTGFSIPVFPPDELGSNAQGTNDWNYRFVSFEYENDGETYITDPCLLVDSEPSPPLEDGTYDTNNRDLYVTISRTGTQTICDCTSGACNSTNLDNTAGPALRQRVASVRVTGLDWTGGPGRSCDPGQPWNYGIPPLTVVAILENGQESQVFNSWFGNPFLLGKSIDISETRSVTVTFADDPDNPILITDLPKLS